MPAPAALARTPRAFDEALVRYLRSLWVRGAPKTWAREVVAFGPHTFPLDLRGPGALPGARRALQGWMRHETAEFRTPMPLAIFQAVFVYFVTSRRYDAAVLLLLSFAAVLRPGEAASLRRADLVGPGEHGEPLFIIVVRDPKTRWFAAPIQHSVLEEPASFALLEWFLAPLAQDAYLWPGPTYDARLQRFERVLSRALTRLGLAGLGLVPSSCRGGGATLLWLRTFNEGLVQRKGRWDSKRTLRHYLQQAGATLVLTQAPPRARELVAALAPLFVLLLTPPVYPRRL